MEFYERVSGARMHAAFHKPLPYFNFFLDKQLLTDILFFVKGCFLVWCGAIAHNVLGLCEVGVFKAKMFNKPQCCLELLMFKFIPSAPISQNPYYGQLFWWRYVN